MAFLVRLLAFFCIVVPFALIALAAFLVTRDRSAIRSCARATSCAQCGQLLGNASLRLADELWAKHFAALREQNPGAMLRILRTVHAVCTRCGARYEFEQEARAFKLRDVVLAYER